MLKTENLFFVRPGKNGQIELLSKNLLNVIGKNNSLSIVARKKIKKCCLSAEIIANYFGVKHEEYEEEERFIPITGLISLLDQKMEQYTNIVLIDNQESIKKMAIYYANILKISHKNLHKIDLLDIHGKKEIIKVKKGCAWWIKPQLSELFTF
ncbi:MAG: hypothetical protein ABIG10_04245 [bacterium]